MSPDHKQLELFVEDDAAAPRHPPDAPLRYENDETIVARALSILARRHRRGRELATPGETKQFLQLRLTSKYTEVFGCIFLDNRHRVIEVEELFFGTIDGAAVHPRVIVQRALLLNAAAIIAYHNHPSGIAEPSRADTLLTNRIRDALALVDLRLIDHFVVADGEVVSFAERGLL